ncbi:MAG: hypothetical protein E7523_06645 [Ruminococcaceae bacterium]|nr:hypothetical protein [Oscillospiraceae bacterium]
MKKASILPLVLCLIVLCCTACKKDTDATQPVYNDMQVSLQPNLTTVPPQNDSSVPTADNSELIDATLPAQEPTTEEPTTQAGPAADVKYRNEYTADGLPSVLYEVIGNGENAVYSGVYCRYVYNGNSLTTMEKWNKNDNGDSLISTTDYGYDGRGHLTRAEERMPDVAGNLYTWCLTEIVNNADGQPATKSVSYLNTDGTVKEQTVYGYTYDDYGREILCTVTQDGDFVSRTETEYVFSGNTLAEKTETTVRYPDTAYEQRNVVKQTFDLNGNVLTKSEDSTGIHYTISYEYDAHGREVSSRTTQSDGTVTEYTATEYDDIGGGCTCITKRIFAQDGSLYSTLITCTDAYGNTYIPQE